MFEALLESYVSGVAEFWSSAFRMRVPHVLFMLILFWLLFGRRCRRYRRRCMHVPCRCRCGGCCYRHDHHEAHGHAEDDEWEWEEDGEWEWVEGDGWDEADDEASEDEDSKGKGSKDD